MTGAGPAWQAGIAGVRLYRRVVAAVWLVGLAARLPFVIGLDAVVVRPLAGLAAGADNDALLVAAAALRPQRATALLATAVAVVLLTAWGVLWRAGVARWLTWRPQPAVRLTEVLGLGLGGWWRYARLWATLGLAELGVVALAAVPAATVVDALDQGSTGAALWLGGAGLAIAGLLAAALMAAWLRAGWELAHPDRRSAVLAFVRGLVVVIRHPLAAALPLLGWGGSAVVAAVLPLACGWYVPELRAALPITILVTVTTGLQAAARVALLTSFAGRAPFAAAE